MEEERQPAATEIDLWADEEEVLPEFTPPAEEVPSLEGHSLALAVVGDDVLMHSRESLAGAGDFAQLPSLLETNKGDIFEQRIRLSPLNAFVLRYALKELKVNIAPGAGELLKEHADRVPRPGATLSEDKRHIIVVAPNLRIYRSALTRVNAAPSKGTYRIAIARFYDFETIVGAMQTKLPRIVFSEKLQALAKEPLPGFDGTLESLKHIPLSVLNTVAANAQSYKALKTSKETLTQKLEKAGVASLHDLLFRLPRRYIDKSHPQDIRDLIEGEVATIIGAIVGVDSLPGDTGGTSFDIKDSVGSTVRVAFWRQHWLRAKFHVGDEVIITGKFSWWMQKPQLNGDSIDIAEDVALLPIVPVYRQSEAKGLTSFLFMASLRELFQRIGPLGLPPYFGRSYEDGYREMLQELHFPSSIAAQREAVEKLAFYELIYSQIIIQEAKTNELSHPGISHRGTPGGLQVRGLKSIPFSLTKDQKRAVVTLNERLADTKPSASLLVADVGAGKTLVAQMACLRAVEAGHQAVIVGPTDNLARQLFATTEKLLTGVAKDDGTPVTAVFLAGGMKVRERKALLKLIESGEADIIVGTHSVFSDSVVYKDLGLVVADEQQKFGVEQRSKLLRSRSDGHIPDLLLQTATPSPRTTAQLMHGSVDVIEMREKPPGRLPIETEWVEDDPQDVIAHAISPIWGDVAREAELGHQTFVITPMVADSGKTDAASVERTYRMLTETVLPHLRIGFIHGQMKGPEQVEALGAFRRKELDVLVASTVVEVGVDIPDATRVVILSADRMGASSLHQIRGRVGRSDKPSKCYLVSLGKSPSSRVRLQALVDSEDGFEIAKIDLETRGEGTLFSTDQSGASQMIFASLARHGDKIEEAKREAQRILKSPLSGLALSDAREKFQSQERLL